MSHILIGLALCGALLIYPGGATIGVAALLLAWAPRKLRGRGTPAFMLWRASRGPTVLGAGGLAGLVVLTLPWPSNPIVSMSFASLSDTGVGGVALSVLAVTALDAWAAAGQSRMAARFACSALSALSLVLLAELLRSPQWGQLLTEGGAGPAMGRFAVAGLLLILAPWAAGPAPERDVRGAADWTARLAIALFLCFPELRVLPVAGTIACVWAAALVIGAAWAGAGRWAVDRLPLLTDGRSAARL